jgi:hypothetical protein
LGPIEPITIKGTFVAHYFGVPLYFSVFVREQVMVIVCEPDKTIESFPIATITPTRPFSGMSKSSPAAEFEVELDRHLVENLGETSFAGSARCYLAIFEKLYRFTPFSDDAQERIRGKCLLELGGVFL